MKYGVIDIGTRATRLLVGDSEDLMDHGFRFSDYHNEGERTEAGRGIRNDGSSCIFEIMELRKTVEFVRKFVDVATEAGVAPENIHAVGTEVFRRVSNWRQVVEILSGAAGVNLQVLDPLEEAETTFTAARVSCSDMYDRDTPFAVIEQGGGSTQITVASVGEDGTIVRHGQASIPQLGTLLLREEFLKSRIYGEKGGGRLVRTVQREVLDYSTELLRECLSANFSLPPDKLVTRAFALGTVITQFHGDSSSKRIHGKMVTRDQLLSDPGSGSILHRYRDTRISSLLRDADEGRIPEDREMIETALQNSFGLPCYAAALTHFGLENLRICGTGLRYGVFFRLVLDEWRDISEFNG